MLFEMSVTLLRRALPLLIRPKVEWSVIASEVIPLRKLYFGYILPLSAIGPIAIAIYGIEYVRSHASFFDGMEALYWNTYWNSTVPLLIAQYIWQLLAIYVTAHFVSWVAPWFAGEKDDLQAFKVLGFALTPMWIGDIFHAIPFFSLNLSMPFLSLCYTGYMLYLGLSILMKTSPPMTLLYVATVVATVSGAFRAPDIVRAMDKLVRQWPALDQNSPAIILVPLAVICILSILAGVMLYQSSQKIFSSKFLLSTGMVGSILWGATAPSKIVSFIKQWPAIDGSTKVMIVAVVIFSMTGLIVLYERHWGVARGQSDSDQ